MTAVRVLLVSTVTWLPRRGPGDEPASFPEGVWLAMGRYLDAGTFTGDQGSNNRIFSVRITLVGIFIGAAIIGLISSAIERRLEELRQGQSAVIEPGHTLIIGRSEKLPVVISELVEANRSNRGHVIVVLSPDDVVDLSDALNRDISDMGDSRLVVRSGMPTRLGDLSPMNAPIGTIVGAGDCAIGIAADDSVFVMDLVPDPWELGDIRVWESLDAKRERSLIVGWNLMAPIIIDEIETHVASNSELVVLIDGDLHDPGAVSAQIEGLGLTNQSLQLVEGDTISRSTILSVADSGVFDHDLILCENPPFGVDEADARVLLSLMHLRAASSVHEGNIVAELRDRSDVELANEGDGDDFIVSQRLISLLLAQLSESPQLVDVFADLFDADGSSVTKHPFERYVAFGSTTFGEVIAEARNWGVVAIGYQCASATDTPGSLAGGLHLNPPKREQITFSAGDQVVVIGERR